MIRSLPGRAAASATVVVLLLAGCGSSGGSGGSGGSDGSDDSDGSPSATQSTGTPQQTASVPALVGTCADPQGWSVLDGSTVDAVQKGTGPLVVMASESDNDPCGGLPLADRLAASGHRVVVFGYSDTSAAGEAKALTELLAVASAGRAGGRWVAVGASLGGRLVIEAAARRPAGLAGIVSLSGETVVQEYRDITPDARRVTTPALVVGSAFDLLTDEAKQSRALHSAMRGRPNDLLVVPDSSAHGFALVDPTSAATKPVIDRITSFVTARLRS